MTPFGRPFNYTNPDSAGLLDPRPDDDPLNINPLLESQSMIREQQNTRVFGSVFGELRVADGLTYRVNFGPDYSTSSLGCYNDPWTHGTVLQPGREQRQPGPAAAGDASQPVGLRLHARQPAACPRKNSPARIASRRRGCTASSRIASRRIRSTRRSFRTARSSGTTSDPASPGNNLSLISEWALQSYMGRLNYTLQRPLLAIGRWSFRRVEPPRAGEQVGVLPVVRLRLAGRRRIVHARLRRGSTSSSCARSYGTTGNTSIAPYQTQGTLASKFYTFGTTRVRGYRPGSIPNPDLTWEKTDQTDIGMDFAMLGSRVSGSVDFYHQNTHDLLLTRLLPVTSGFTSTLQNIGSTSNRGYEIGLSTVNLQNRSGLTWTSDINVSHEQEQDHGAGEWRDVRTSATSGSSASRSTCRGDPQRRVFFDWKWRRHLAVSPTPSR